MHKRSVSGFYSWLHCSLLSCCVLLNGPSKSPACWNIRAILPRSPYLLCPHFSKEKKKVLLAIRKIPLPVSSWETCCLVGRKYFFTLVCWQNPTWLSLFAVLGALCGMWSALWAVLDPWTTLGLSKEAASGLMCSLHGEHRAEQISCPRNTPKSLSDLHGGAQKAWQPLSFQTSLHLRIHWLC